MRLLRHLPRFRQAYRALGELEARESWSRTQIEAWQLDRLNAVWTHARAHVPYYRRLAASLPPHFTSLAEFSGLVPLLHKEHVRERSGDLLSAQPAPGRWRFTGGSTGAVTRVYWPTEGHREVLQGRYRFYASWGLDLYDRMAYLWGHAASFAPGLKGWLAWLRRPLEDWLRNRIRLSAYRLGQAHLRRHLDRLTRSRAAALYGYSSAIALLGREAQGCGWRCPTLRLAILTAEPAFPPLLEAAERGLGVPAVVEYGSVECGLLAAEATDRTLRVREDLVLLETLPQPDGRHEIVVSVLNNPSFPLLRYALGDATSAPLQRPGRGFAVLADVAGRHNDFIVTRSGRPLHWTHLDHVVGVFKGVRRFRAQQHADGSLRVELEAEDPARPPDAVGLKQAVGDILEGYPIELAVVAALPPNRAGKHRWVESALAQPVSTGPRGAARMIVQSH
jgi:phenylacetate-CoA ligase